MTGAEFITRLAKMVPDAYAGKAQLRTLQRRIKTWRAVKAKALILGALGRKSATKQARGLGHASLVERLGNENLKLGNIPS